MKAPEKIYVSTDPFGCLHAYDCENHPPIVEEYIRTDAFIEKIIKYLYDNNKGFILTEKDIEDLRKYIKGE